MTTAQLPAAQATSPYGQRALPRDVELPGDPMPLRRHLAQLRRERLRHEAELERERDDGGDDP
jgi:hypothetical protein